jgi:hypothetical protein
LCHAAPCGGSIDIVFQGDQQVRLLAASGAVMAAAIATASAAETGCDRYAALDRLPDRFDEILRGDFAGVGVELVVSSDGTCTCTNSPKVDRAAGKPVPKDVSWSCRAATPNDRRTD